MMAGSTMAVVLLQVRARPGTRTHTLRAAHLCFQCLTRAFRGCVVLVLVRAICTLVDNNATAHTCAEQVCGAALIRLCFGAYVCCFVLVNLVGKKKD